MILLIFLLMILNFWRSHNFNIDVQKYISWRVFINNTIILFISGFSYHLLSFLSSYLIIFIFIVGMALLLFIKGGLT